MTTDCIPVITSDKIRHDLPRKIALKSMTIKNLIEDLGDEGDEPIPLPAINDFIMKKILEFFEIVQDEKIEIPEDCTKRCDVVFNETYQKMLTNYGWKITAEIYSASNFLDIGDLYHSCAKNLGSILINKTYKELMPIDNGEFCKMLNMTDPELRTEIKSQ